jgi:hypothetical protein
MKFIVTVVSALMGTSLIGHVGGDRMLSDAIYIPRLNLGVSWLALTFVGLTLVLGTIIYRKK